MRAFLTATRRDTQQNLPHIHFQPLAEGLFRFIQLIVLRRLLRTPLQPALLLQLLSYVMPNVVLHTQGMQGTRCVGACCVQRRDRIYKKQGLLREAVWIGQFR